MTLCAGLCQRAVGVLATLVIMVTIATAQAITPPSTTDYRTWFNYGGDHRIKETRFAIVLESSLRVYELDDRSGAFLIRTGLQYDIRNWFRISGGYHYQINEPGRDRPGVPEHRLWQGIMIRHKAGQIPFVHRTRLEHRWLAPDLAGGEYAYRNRVRHMSRAVIPLTKHAGPKYYIAGTNEVFINFGKGTTHVFDQNRSTVAFGYHVGAIGNLEVGYLLQVQNSPSHVKSYHNILSVSFGSSLPFGKK